MNLGDNLKKLRKEYNLSQEQLADKLGVSRQSVSKWESNLAYPEMDKVLQICKMFNLNIDELLNQDIKNVNENKKSKLTINKYIDDFLEFVTKTIDIFINMKFIDRVKFILEQCFIIFIIYLFAIIIGGVGNYLINTLFEFLPYNIYRIIHLICSDIYIVISLIVGIILFFHIFKTRYLDYYVIINNDNNSEDVDNDNNDYNNSDNKTYFLSKKKEKIIIRDPEHSGYNFISGLLRCLLFIIKLLIIFVSIWFCFSLISLAIVLIMSFMFIKTGLLFVGSFIIIISSMIINLIILDIGYNFIVNKSSNKRLLFISFLCSLIGLGIGIGLCFISSINFKIETDYSVKDIEYIDMDDDIVIVNSWGDNVEYVSENRDNIKIEIEHSRFFKNNIDKHNKYVYIDIKENYDNVMEIIREEIDSINKKKITNYSSYKIIVYASPSNIDKIIKNDDNRYKNYEYDE